MIGRGRDIDRSVLAPERGELRYRRILLKLSGEALLGGMPYGVDPAFCAFVAKQDFVLAGVELLPLIYELRGDAKFSTAAKSGVTRSAD